MRKEGIRFRSRVSGLEWEVGEEGYVTRLDGLRAAGSAWTGAKLDGADLDDADFSYARLGDDLNTALEIWSWRNLVDVLLRRPNATLTMQNGWQGTSLPKGPASFDRTSVRRVTFENFSGPGVVVDEVQLLAMEIPLPADARSLRTAPIIGRSRAIATECRPNQLRQ